MKVRRKTARETAEMPPEVRLLSGANFKTTSEHKPGPRARPRLGYGGRASRAIGSLKRSHLSINSKRNPSLSIITPIQCNCPISSSLHTTSTEHESSMIRHSESRTHELLRSPLPSETPVPIGLNIESSEKKTFCRLKAATRRKPSGTLSFAGVLFCAMFVVATTQTDWVNAKDQDLIGQQWVDEIWILRILESLCW